MAPGNHDREFDIVLASATGYTGVLTAMAIVEQLPTNLKWAIVGRSQTKLQDLAARLKEAGPDRIEPAIEAIHLDQVDQVAAVVKRAKVCISTVLYHSVGDVVVQACAENGTDYIDCTGNVPQVGRWVSSYHETAKSNGAAIIVGSGYFSAPQDLVTWAAVNELARQASAKTKEVVLTYPKATTVEVSGGTIESIASALLLDHSLVAASQKPWYLSPIRGTLPIEDPAGTRRDPHLGLLVATSHGALQNRSFVHRSWGLFGGDAGYGSQFRYSEYESATSMLDATTKRVTKSVLDTLLSSSFLYHYILRPMFPAAGEGPDVETQRLGRTVGVQAVAIADSNDNDGDTVRSFSSFHFKGGSYRCTAVFLAQGAASLLYSRKLGGGYEGGILTPAFLGQDLIDRMNSAGAEFETRML